ncbi:MAG: VanZ family protein [Lachnospiraceae bacterium]|nr:VanZ family protein [Lachnospiraceae bacterium]
MKIKKHPWRWIFIGLTLLWMVFIFLMSEAPADLSDRTSGRLVNFVQQVFYRKWDALEPADWEKQMWQLHYLLRKIAHFTEYIILGADLSLILMTFEKPFSFRFLTGFFAGVLYAVSDEFHQTFVAGRDGAVFDVCIDAGGVFVGVLLVLGIFAMAEADRSRKRSLLQHMRS